MNHKTNLIINFICKLPQEVLKEKPLDDLLKKYTFLISLIDFLNQNEKLKINLYINGLLVSYLDKKVPDFSSKIRTLLERNQLELLCGGIYEPLFSFIPKDDRQSQLLLMNRLLNHNFGYNAIGAYLTENIWETSLAIDLSKAKIEYTFLPKDYFTNSNLKNDEISGYYITEEEARKIAVFPVFKTINDSDLKHSPEEILNVIQNSSINNFNCISLDILPKNEDELNWIKELFKLLSSETSTFNTTLFNEYFHKNKPTGRVYLSASQENKESQKKSLLKYTEANLLHKKMLRVSKKINSAKEGKSRFKVIKEMIGQAQDLLLKGQTNIAYWDNPTYGLYMPDLRHHTYANLIKAENLIDISSRHASKWIQVSEADYDCDGNDEVIIETETQNIYISPSSGGSITEHDYRSKNINLTATISRKKENYHNDIQALSPSTKKDEKWVSSESSTALLTKPSTTGSEISPLTYDTYPRFSLIEHFLKPDLEFKDILSNKLPLLTKEAINSYQIEKIKAKEESCKVSLLSTVKLANLEQISDIEIKKQFNTRSGDSSLIIDYELLNKGSQSIEIIMGVELNFSILTDEKNNSFLYLDGNQKNKTPNSELSSREELKNINHISVYNQKQNLDFSLSWNKACDLYRYPIETISLKNNHLEKIFQGLTIMPCWKLNLEPNTPWELSIKQDIQTMSNYES